MLLAAPRFGLIGLLLIVGLLYFTGAGTWMWARIEGLSTSCYAATQRLGTTMGGRICEQVADGVAALNAFGVALNDKIQGYEDRLVGNSGVENLHGLQSQILDSVGSLAGSQERLSQLMHAGPGAKPSGSSAAQFQQAIDSFTVGQFYMQDGGNASQALPWLQQGAAQPQGLGVLSQLSLGSIYAQGGAGVPQNPDVAQAYLEQAKQSLGVLSHSSSAQSQQMLQTLPVSPQALEQQINQAIRQLKLKK